MKSKYNGLLFCIAIFFFIAGSGQGAFPNNDYDIFGFILLFCALMGFLHNLRQAKKNES